MRDIKFKFVIKNGKETLLSDSYSLDEIIKNDFDKESVFEDLEEKHGCNGNCTNESVNHCECGTIFDEAEIIGKIECVGLKDKNGKEIYEGDKVSFSVFDHNGLDTQYKGYVVWCGSRFMIWNKPDDEFYGSDGGFDLDIIVEQDEELEVIGNIHQNPELLKTGE